MLCSLVVLGSAKNDLREIYRFIAEDNPSKALNWIETLEQKRRCFLNFRSLDEFTSHLTEF